MSNSKDGRLIRRTVYVGPTMDEAIQQLAEEWGVSYTEVANLMFERGMTIEGLRKAGYEILARKADKELPFNDDRPLRRRLIDEDL